MHAAPPLPHETLRQSVVEGLGVLDTGTDARFNELAELAAFVAHTPMALLSLIDGDRQWFKASVGVDLEAILGPGVSEIPRDVSFCQHTIVAETMIVPDTLIDERFVDSPFVVGPPNLRFYAGVSLVVDGHNVGTLCVLDTRPRTFLTDERRALEILGRQASAQLLLRRMFDDA